jgi:cytochrome P450
VFLAYELAKHPILFRTLATELSKYKDIDSFKSIELEKLPHLNAVIRETLRMWPPVPSPFFRVCPPQGTILGDYYIPGGVTATCF